MYIEVTQGDFLEITLSQSNPRPTESNIFIFTVYKFYLDLKKKSLSAGIQAKYLRKLSR